MWETVTINLISTFLVALLAYAGARYGANRAAESQLNTAAMNAFLTAKLNAYTEFERAVENWAVNPCDQSVARVHGAANVVNLVASRETIYALDKVQKIIADYPDAHNLDTAQFRQYRRSAMDAMHQDLLVYPTPKAEKN